MEEEPTDHLLDLISGGQKRKDTKKAAAAASSKTAAPAKAPAKGKPAQK